jgi:CDP-diacylglycerol--glycerol-3-phosphate 3-phosphatidyltransferase
MFPLNLPNLLTVVRILLVPVVVVALLEETPNADTLAAIVFAVAAFTDGLDGYIARSRGSITTFGKLMDPIADKLLIIAPLVSLVSLGRIDAWVAMVIIAREFAVTALRMVAVEQGVVIPASPLGKAKTIFQIAAIFAVIAFQSTPLPVDLLVYAAVIVTLVSGADYFLGLRRRIDEARRERSDQAAGVSSHSRIVT